ncbi:VWA domain-containing protein, partial [bacterium]|nr:VWA domain-containing protein [bacterium]
MGYGNYSQAAHDALLKGRTNIPAQQVFKQSQCHPLMNPHGVKLRESRDGSDHPQSISIVFALDVTGSMGDIPRLLATKQLPVFMKVLMGCEIPDPQLMFMAIGDAYSDSSPLQVGQFESTAELMDQWLTWSYLEGGGGGSGEESYELGMYFLAAHTEMDCMVKRKKRGYLFMTGDEFPYAVLPK